jgi:hypothetical protein
MVSEWYKDSTSGRFPQGKDGGCQGENMVWFCGMANLRMQVRPKAKSSRLVTVTIDAGAFERLAAGFGMFSGEFVESIEDAERDAKAGRVRKIKSLRDLDR